MLNGVTKASSNTNFGLSHLKVLILLKKSAREAKIVNYKKFEDLELSEPDALALYGFRRDARLYLQPRAGLAPSRF